MMRFRLLLILACFLITGCTDAYYDAQKAYYNAQAMAIANKPPLSRVVLEDGVIIETADPNALKTITQARNPVVAVLSTVLTSTPVSIIAGGWSARELIMASTGDNNSLTTSDNHSATSEPTVVTQPAPVLVPPAEPVIVTQPEPIVVNPEIVKPEIVITPGGVSGN